MSFRFWTTRSAIMPREDKGGFGHDDNVRSPPPPIAVERTGSFSSVARFLGTWNSQFLYALRYTYVDARSFFRGTVSSILNTAGFVYSIGVELLLTSRRTFKRKWKPILDALQLFLDTTGISVELQRGLNRRFLVNIAILAKIQDKILMRRGAKGSPPDFDRRSLAAFEGHDATTNAAPHVHPKEEAQHYVKYAVAAYGIPMIQAAEVSTYGSIQSCTESNSPPQSQKRIDDTGKGPHRGRRSMSPSDSFYTPESLLSVMTVHIGIPEEDIYLMNVADDVVDNLRHFVAVDRGHKAVVLSIRGTLALSEVIIDIGGFSRPYCGGEAHSEIANAAERIWDTAGGLIVELLAKNDGFELVICGHSLGGGAASLLNILLHEDDRSKLGGRRCRCFAFASPPVYTPLEAAKDAVNACTNYIHDNDSVPFLSIDSVRHLFAAINVIEDCNLTTLTRCRILMGSYSDIDLITLLRVERALAEPLRTIKGAPVLLIPACANVWMRHVDEEHNISSDNARLNPEALEELPPGTPYDSVLADSAKLARLWVQLETDMVNDHFPNEYEASLYNLRD
jgi:Lipase (class 3)